MAGEQQPSENSFRERFVGVFRRLGRFLKSKKERKERKVHRKRGQKLLLQKETVKELGIYAVFMLTLNIAIFGASSVDRYYLTTVYTELLVNREFGHDVTFTSVASVHGIWQYLEDVALPFLYYRYEYPSNKKEAIRQIVYENSMLGFPRIRQIRVRNNSCDIPTEFRNIITSCYSPYHKEYEDTSTFGPGNGTAWSYHTEEELAGLGYNGRVATYGGGGSYEDLGSTYEEARGKIEILKQLNWIRRGSRFIVLDFSTYNVNVNLLTFVKLVFELPATGGVIPSYTINCMTFLRYITSWDTFILASEIIFCMFTLYYMVEEIVEIHEDYLSYAKESWNYMDAIILMISLFCISFSIYRTMLIRAVLHNLFIETNKFFNFENLEHWNNLYKLMVAILSYLCWIKVFKYITFNLTMVQLATTLSRCAKDVAGFAVMFFIIFFAYAELGFLLFGNQLEDFMLLHYSMYSLLRTILGDFDFKALEQVDRIVGPIFFITYVFFVFFVLLNMFLAIINDTYMEVKSELKARHAHVNVLSSALKAYAVFANKVNLFRGKPAKPDVPPKTEYPSMTKIAESLPEIDVVPPSAPPSESSTPSTPSIPVTPSISATPSIADSDKPDKDQPSLQKTPTLKGRPKFSDTLKNAIITKKSPADEDKAPICSISRREFDNLVRKVDDLMENLERVHNEIMPQLSGVALRLEILTSKKKSTYRIEH